MATAATEFPTVPDSTGQFGGMFVPETLMAPLQELADACESAINDPAFPAEIDDSLHNYVGRPTPLYFTERRTELPGGAEIHLKSEDLLHTGAHKLNKAPGHMLLAKRLEKKRIIAETGSGQHGVATATVCALRHPRARKRPRDGLRLEDRRQPAEELHPHRQSIRPRRQGRGAGFEIPARLTHRASVKLENPTT